MFTCKLKIKNTNAPVTKCPFWVWNTGLYHGGSFGLLRWRHFFEGEGTVLRKRARHLFTGEGIILCSAFVVTRLVCNIEHYLVFILNTILCLKVDHGLKMNTCFYSDIDDDLTLITDLIGDHIKAFACWE